MGQACQSARSVFPVARTRACRPAHAHRRLRGTRGREHGSSGQAVPGPGEAPAVVTRRLGSFAVPFPGTWGAGASGGAVARPLRDGPSAARVSHMVSFWDWGEAVCVPSLAAWRAEWGEHPVPRMVVLSIVSCTAPATWWRRCYHRALSRSFPAGVPSLFI